MFNKPWDYQGMFKTKLTIIEWSDSSRAYSYVLKNFQVEFLIKHSGPYILV